MQIKGSSMKKLSRGVFDLRRKQKQLSEGAKEHRTEIKRQCVFPQALRGIGKVAHHLLSLTGTNKRAAA